MPSIEITRVGTSDLSVLKHNFAKLLNEKFAHEETPSTTLLELIAKRGLTDKQVQTSAKRRARYISTAQEPRQQPSQALK